MWYYNKASLLYSLKTLGKLQRQAALWIVGAFKTALIFGIKAITSLIPIYLHLQKLSGRSQLKVYSLSTNHILQSLMENNSNTFTHLHPILLSSLTRR